MVKARAAPIKPGLIRRVLQEAARAPEVEARLQATEPGLTVRISGDRELRRLNRNFLGEDHATDVLSFPSGEGEYLGDIVVSWAAVERQAREFGHPPEVEAVLLCVHGLLHLLGWDHAETVEEREMAGLTLACLERAGISPAPGRL